MIGQVIAWWLSSTLIGALALPLCWRFFGRLSDRGFGFARALGLLASGYILWLGASTGVLKNDLGGALTALGVLAGLGLWAGAGQWRDLKAWLRGHWRTVAAMETLFLVGFAFWAWVRAYNPEIVATEKPMELAFLNSVMHSDTFPPRDPWLSGYGISYYYFGYIIVGMLTRLTGVPTGVAFNLANAAWFGLTLLGAYAVVYNLVGHRESKPGHLLSALLGPWFVVISGNLEGFLEVLHAKHLFWRPGADGVLTSGFWTWIGLKDLQNPPAPIPTWIPGRYLWWWRASRVVHDIDLSGGSVEVIDEFPFFSFLLADNHPHLLALPFVLLAIGLILQVFVSLKPGEVRLGGTKAAPNSIEAMVLVSVIVVMTAALGRAIPLIAAGAATAEILASVLKVVVLFGVVVALLDNLVMILLGLTPALLESSAFWTAAWLLGSLAFLNTWDFPIYMSLLLAVLWWVNRSTRFSDLWRPLLATAAALGTAGVAFYLPWYPGFTSQAAGILPNIAFPTRLVQLVVMFGTMLAPIIAWLALRAHQDRDSMRWRLIPALGLGLPIVLFLLSAGVGLLILIGRPVLSEDSLNQMGAASLNAAIPEVMRRWAASGSAIVLSLLLSAAVMVMLSRRPAQAARSEAREAWPLAVMMAGMGLLLVLAPEFFYLRDFFGTRMNTVFKFYFAAWILWGLASAYFVHELWSGPLGRRTVLAIVAILPLLLGLVYPVFGILTKTNEFKAANGPTLDGTAHLTREESADHAAIQWIGQNLAPGVIAEAVGGSYTLYGRISANTGFPTVLGWDFHEIQWRGSAEAQGSRRADIEHLYETREPEEALQILERYNIDYVYIGPLERSTYRPVLEAKFAALMNLVYQDADVLIYALPGKGPLP